MNNSIQEIFNSFKKIDDPKITYDDELTIKYLVTKQYLEKNKLNESEELLSTIIDKINNKNI